MPPNLCRLAQLVGEAAKSPGCVIEVGCFQGATTVWLCKTLSTLGREREYFALDTFSGFISKHLEFEAISRGKDTTKIERQFSVNSKKIFDKTIFVVSWPLN